MRSVLSLDQQTNSEIDLATQKERMGKPTFPTSRTGNP